MLNDPYADLAQALRHELAGEVHFDTMTRVLYSTDASNYQIDPVGVVVPRDADDVVATVTLCAEHNVPVLPRGSGSSLAGQAVGPAVIIDYTKWMDAVLEINATEQWVRAQPGIVLDRVNRATLAHGLQFGPDPASADRATVGGIVGNNATGAHSILYGMAVDHVLAVKAVLADGSMARFSQLNLAQIRVKGSSASWEGKLYRDLPALLQEYRSDIDAHFPKHWRRASGYNLTHLTRLMDQGLFNFAPLLAGSEGTLAAMTEVTLHLVHKPPLTALLILNFDDIVDAMETTNVILEKSPSAVELIDRQILRAARTVPAFSRRMTFVHGDPEAVLAVEFYGGSETELRSKLDDLVAYLQAAGYRGEMRRALTPEAQADVWAVRKSGLGLLMNVYGNYKPIAFMEDIAVPVAQLAPYVQDMQNLLADFDTTGAFYAHASAGCLHIRPMFNLKDGQEIKKMHQLASAACDLALRYGGAMSGEHGDGLARSEFNARIFGPRLYELLQRVKAIFDPHNIMNPGKIVDPPPMTENLRYGSDYQTVTFPTFLDFSAEKGFGGAVEMCNGAGSCHKLDLGVMCPTYRATRDEEASTRGRANALRAAISGRLPGGLDNKELYDILSLCVGCKGCKAECPSAVDMNKLKTEFKAQYYDRNGLPLRNRLFGDIHRWSKMAAPVAPVANWALRSAPSRWALQKVGMHPARHLPTFADETFFHWFEHTHKPAPGPRGQVLLYHDTFMNFNDPHIGKAAVRVLEAAGYEVLVERKVTGDGRPLLSQGMVKQARRYAAVNIKALLPYIRADVPVVGIEPSGILTMKDEYSDLLPGPETSEFAQGLLTIDEFLANLLRQDPAALPFNRIPRKALLHGHCHQKALVGTAPARFVLESLPGWQINEVKAGCCGMAGAFGYETEHFKLSRQIGEEHLLPAVRAADPDTVIVADGTSCRQQILDFAGRHAVHLVEAVAMAIEQP